MADLTPPDPVGGGARPAPRAFCTVATRSHLAFVSALSETLRSSGNPEPLVVLVADAARGELPEDTPALRYLGFEAVGAGLPPLIRYYYDPFELCNALKPFLVGLLLGDAPHSRVIYLDSDLLVTGSFGGIWDAFGRASLLLTPHRLTVPGPGEPFANEVDIADMGVLNGGFAAWRGGPDAAAILAWMRSRYVTLGFCDRRNGMFVDQKLLPLLLQYFPEAVSILRDPGLNVAFWNAPERGVSRSADGRWTAAGSPVVFFHMSGFRVGRPDAICSYLPQAANERILAASPWLREVMAPYRDGLVRHGVREGPAPGRTAFDTYGGVRLTPAFRRMLFAKGSLDRGSPAFWKVWLTERLREAKRAVVGPFRG